jgi:hypothetical protein
VLPEGASVVVVDVDAELPQAARPAANTTTIGAIKSLRMSFYALPGIIPTEGPGIPGASRATDRA